MTVLTFHLPFVGFTYTMGSSLCDNPPRSAMVTREQETGIITQAPLGE